MNEGNGYHGNGHQGNGKSQGNSPIGIKTPPKESPPVFTPSRDSEKAVVLKQSPVWSRTVTWTIVGVATAGIVWSWFAKIELVVQATGQLKPQGYVTEVQAPINGVVKAVYVKDGDEVKKGQLLLKLDSVASLSQLDSLKRIRLSTSQENEFYRALMEKQLNGAQVEQALFRLKLPSQIASLARNRSALIAENELFETQLLGNQGGATLTAQQIARLEAAKRESDSRSLAARLEVDQLGKQFNQTVAKLADSREQLITDRQVLNEIKSRNEKSIKQAEEGLDIDEKILKDLEPLVEEGALGKYQVNKQRQAVSDRYKDLIEKRANGLVEFNKQVQQIQDRLTKISELEQEEKRLTVMMAQAQQKFANSKAITEKDLQDKIAENQKKIAEIDSQLTRTLVDNEKKIAELDSKISEAKQTLKYQEILAPKDGKVFDLKASPGYVTNLKRDKDGEVVLKIVPAGCPIKKTDDLGGCLLAEVDVTNQDIGFVRKDQKADVRIDTFPFSQFGDIKGKVISIGSDALPPDETHKYYRFPVKIELDSQMLKIEDKTIPLQSGMAVSANIKVREDRRVWDLMTELFNKQVDNLKQVR